tara:strand:- start:662 stop:1246 length:585 start_codon:yes stop_codon:yes gene_type:complete
MSGTLSIGNKEIFNHSDATDKVTTSEFVSPIIEIDQWVLDTTFDSTTTNETLVTGWARPTHSFFGRIGTGLTYSAGTFTFPKTGLYQINLHALPRENTGNADSEMVTLVRVSVNNGSSYSHFLHAIDAAETNYSARSGTSTHGLLNVTSISGANAVSFQIAVESLSSGNQLMGRNTSNNGIRTNFIIQRIGVAQ